MQELIDLIYVEGNILLTMVNLTFLIFAFDCLLSFASALKSIKGAVS